LLFEKSKEIFMDCKLKTPNSGFTVVLIAWGYANNPPLEKARAATGIITG